MGKIVIIRKTEVLLYHGKEHESVGLRYRVTFPENAFRMSRITAFEDPEAAEMPGGDAGDVEVTLVPMKLGLFRVREESIFRGSVEESKDQLYWVISDCSLFRPIHRILYRIFRQDTGCDNHLTDDAVVVDAVVADADEDQFLLQ